jgi:predicted nucleic acid binding AN1-type Zn finger protein
MSTPECIVCGTESNRLYKCKICGEHFCEECGDKEERICLFCMDSEQNSEEDDDWEIDNEDWK